jgi:hypothetical protein
MKYLLIISILMAAAAPAVAAEFVVTDTVLRPAEKTPPIGVNDWGKSGAIEWAANNFVLNAGNEPIYRRGMYRAKAVGPDWFEMDGPGTSWYDLYASGFLSGADARIYRLVDKEGQPLPIKPNPQGGYIDVAKADRVLFVGTTRVVPEGSPGFPDGGWVANRYAVVHPHSNLASNQTTCTDAAGLSNGRTYWYTVVAVGSGDAESEPSNEVSATPQAGKARAATGDVKAGPAPDRSKPKEKPEPPQELTAVAGDGCVTLTWKPSPSANVLGYRLKRSTAPAAEQANRVYLQPGGPALSPWDYIVLERRFDNFDMKYVNTRVRGIGNPSDAPEWYWRADLSKVSFAFAPHPPPVPAEMVEPGETCLRIDAKAGEHQIRQFVFIGTNHGDESIWYGQLEPGKHYRLEVWLRQDGLKDGAVKFSYAGGYPGIATNFTVTGAWQKFTYAFDGPPRPVEPNHFGHTLTFAGPGTLWLDNFRIYRCDAPSEAGQQYAPNRTVLDELLRSQPATGRKGVHRIWFLKRDTTMASILSWYANSAVSPDWNTRVGGTIQMTLPMALTFDLATGDAPATRMRPWLVLQHLLHSEQDWQNLIEYLAAPYDPKRDTPQSKPWAYRRYQQRGTGAPWTDEFAEIIIEFGNETWHNGAIDDWIGFGRHGAIWQGGPEYGFFARYLIANIKASPFWKSQQLDRKIRFSLGGGYNGSVGKDGRVTGYGEEAMQNCPDATCLGHANYVGPKWETGQKAFDQLNDAGFQATLLGFVAGPEANQAKMGEARAALAKTHHEYDIAAYEGGPSGYPIPTMGRGTREQARIAEFYGKSLAMAVAALDAWLGSYRHGWTEQAYLGYATGRMWSSHTPLWQEFRAHCAWRALTLRNRFASGALMAVEPKDVPVISWDKKEYPAVAAYALRDGARWSVFLLSRQLDAAHPVTVRLPFANANKVTLHTLAGDPRANNFDAENVAIRSQDLPANTVTGGVLEIAALPPGNIQLYVIEQAK